MLLLKYGAMDQMTTTGSTETCFFSIEVTEHMFLMPVYIKNIRKGVCEKLNQRIFEYSSELHGILVTFSNLAILQKTGEIHDDNPHVHFNVKYTATIFQPHLGAVLKGVINKVGEDYFTCLVYDCFTVHVRLLSDKYDSTILSDIEENKMVLVCITRIPDGRESITLHGELYVEKQDRKKQGLKRRINEKDHSFKKKKRKIERERNL